MTGLLCVRHAGFAGDWLGGMLMPQGCCARPEDETEHEQGNVNQGVEMDAETKLLVERILLVILGSLCGGLVTHLLWRHRRRIEREDAARDAREGRRRQQLQTAARPLLQTLADLQGELSMMQPNQRAYGLILGSYYERIHKDTALLGHELGDDEQWALAEAMRRLCEEKATGEPEYTAEVAACAASELDVLVRSWLE